MTLPGMPIAAGDPGVFVCGPADLAPWDGEPLPSTPRERLAVVRTPVRHSWLVLTTCMSCNPRTGVYCKEHNAGNWWLTNWGTGGKKKTRPAQPLDAGT